MWADEIVEETRKVRAQHAARFNYDLGAIFRDLKEKESRGGREVVSLPHKAAEPATAAKR